MAGQALITMTPAEVQSLGTGLASRMSMGQLKAAVRLFDSLTTATAEQNTISIPHLRLAFLNHVKSCLRMPAGGATSGGSQQTGFEMELTSLIGVSQLLSSWPNHEMQNGGRRQSWELRSMDELAVHLDLESTSWGALMGKPMAIQTGKESHGGVLLATPPFTVTWVERPDGTTSLCCRFPIVLWSEEDAVILPPDTTSPDGTATPFYVDPPDQPGAHRDMFKTWGRRVAGELCRLGFPMSKLVRSHLPAEYMSDSGVASDSSDSWE